MTQSDAHVVIGVSVILLYILYKLKVRLGNMRGKRRKMSCGNSSGERAESARHTHTRDMLHARIDAERTLSAAKLENAEERGYFKAIKEENERLRDAQSAIDAKNGGA